MNCCLTAVLFSGVLLSLGNKEPIRVIKTHDWSVNRWLIIIPQKGSFLNTACHCDHFHSKDHSCSICTKRRHYSQWFNNTPFYFSQDKKNVNPQILWTLFTQNPILSIHPSSITYLESGWGGSSQSRAAQISLSPTTLSSSSLSGSSQCGEGAEILLRAPGPDKLSPKTHLLMRKAIVGADRNGGRPRWPAPGGWSSACKVQPGTVQRGNMGSPYRGLMACRRGRGHCVGWEPKAESHSVPIKITLCYLKLWFSKHQLLGGTRGCWQKYAFKRVIIRCDQLSSNCCEP